MQSRSVRFVAVFAVLAMMVAPLAAATFESSDSDAEGIDYTKYYYDQLKPAGKWIYDSVKNTTVFQLEYTESFSVMSDLGIESTNFDDIKKDVNDQISKGTKALSLEQPKAIYWLKLSYSLLVSTSDGSVVSNITVKVTFDGADYSTYGSNKAVSDGQIDIKLNDIKPTLGTGDRQSKIKAIHDTLCNNLTYDDTPTSSCQVRSLYTALVGDGKVVCEGYAKAFKAICDNNNIPCLIITGDAGAEYSGDPKTLQTEAHMWNYVMLENGCWYLVDVTWDDQSAIVYDYYLAGTETVGFNETKIGTSHDPTRGASSTCTGYGFTVPTLSMIAAEDPSYIVTFMNGTEVFRKVAVEQGCAMTQLTEQPTKEGYKFLRWCTDEALTTPWVWTDPVNSNMTLHAAFTANPVRINLIDGDSVSCIYVEKNVPTKLTELANPSSDGKKFLGWNTAKDGTGIYYTSEDTVTFDKDLNLYAVWEQPKDDVFSKTISQMNEFLAGESVISGVSNTVLSIAVCSGVLLLIGFLLIRIKK